MDPSEHLKLLHAAYCRLTGNEMRWSYEAENVWYGWWKIGNREGDLAVTIAYLKRLYQKRPDILTATLRLRRLIGDTLYFEQMLAEAKKVQRVKQERTERDKILEATGRKPEEKPTERSAGHVLDDLFFAKQRETPEWKELMKLKENLT